MSQQTLPIQQETHSERSDSELSETQQILVENIREAALDRMEDRPLSGVAELRLSDYFRELFVLRNRRNTAAEHGELDRARELTEDIEDLLRDLKRIGAPYHPAFGNRADWERMDASDPAKHDYDWNREGDY
jgi:hypothetical protein